eukprot:gene24660-29795_t
MRLIECNKPKKHLFKFSSDQPLSKRMESIPLYNETINRNATTVFLGRQGSGKTSLVMSILQDRNGWRKVFDKVWVVLPGSSLSNIQSSPFSKLPNEQILTELDYESLSTIYNDIQERAEENADLSPAERKRTLLIMDDVGTQFRDKELRRMLQTMIANERHLNLSIAMICQSWKQLEPSLRSLINNLFMFRVSKAQTEAVYREILEVPKDKMDRLIRLVYQEPHDFMGINCNSRAMFRNYDRIELYDEDETDAK